MTRILIDMDEIIVDCLGGMLRHYNADNNTKHTKEDIKEWPFESNFQGADNCLKHDGFFTQLNPLEGAIEGMRLLNDFAHEYNHELLICSSPSKNPNSAAEKLRWISMYLPFFNERNYILTKHKHTIQADIFIDDSPYNLYMYGKHWPQAHLITIEYEYNKGLGDSVFSIPSYMDTDTAWIILVRYVKSVLKIENKVRKLLRPFKM